MATDLHRPVRMLALLKPLLLLTITPFRPPVNVSLCSDSSRAHLILREPLVHTMQTTMLTGRLLLPWGPRALRAGVGLHLALLTTKAMIPTVPLQVQTRLT